MEYSFDVGGNIEKKEIYRYTEDNVPSTIPEIVNYKYEDEGGWKDLLTEYNSQALEYDEIGNLSEDGLYAYVWEEGRQLTEISNAADTNQKIAEFTYNDSGIRTSKKANGITTKYHLVGDTVTYETNGTDSIYYTYQ